MGQLHADNITNVQVRLLLLAALCKEHVLYIGPPGTAKSEVGRRLTRLVDGAYFERLLTRFSVPEVRCRTPQPCFSVLEVRCSTPCPSLPVPEIKYSTPCPCSSVPEVQHTLNPAS